MRRSESSFPKLRSAAGRADSQYVGLAEPGGTPDDTAMSSEEIAELEKLIAHLRDHPEAYRAYLQTQEAAYIEAIQQFEKSAPRAKGIKRRLVS